MVPLLALLGVEEGGVRGLRVYYMVYRLQASISEMIPPGCLVMLTPIVVGECAGLNVEPQLTRVGRGP